jgi:hypothetical protein
MNTAKTVTTAVFAVVSRAVSAVGRAGARILRASRRVVLGRLIDCGDIALMRSERARVCGEVGVGVPVFLVAEFTVAHSKMKR